MSKLFSDQAKTIVADAEKRQITAMITTPKPDRAGDIVMPLGCDAGGFLRSATVLFNHDQAQPVARCTGLDIKADGIRATATFPPAGTSQISDEVFALIKARTLNAISIGFRPIEATPIKSGGTITGMRFDTWELLEWSVVSVPCNPQALIEQRSVYRKHAAATRAPDPLPSGAVSSLAVPQEGASKRTDKAAPSPQFKERTMYAFPRDPAYDDPATLFGGLIRLSMRCGKSTNPDTKMQVAEEIYGGHNHPVVMAYAKALTKDAITAHGGLFVIPNDFASMLIPALLPNVVMRQAGATALPMPHGNLTVPAIASSAGVSWIGTGPSIETIPVGEPGFGAVEAISHKLVCLIPLSNSLLDYAMPNFDKLLADHLAAAIGAAEDAAFIRSDGTLNMPIGLRQFCLSQGNVVVSTAAYTPATVLAELVGAAKLVLAKNVPMRKPAWIFHPSTILFLRQLQNNAGIFPFAQEMAAGTLLGWRFYATTAIPLTLTMGSNSDCSEAYLVDAAEALIFDGPDFELTLAGGGSWTDAGGLHHGFQTDTSLLRCVCGRDFNLMHAEAAAMISGLRWHL